MLTKKYVFEEEFDYGHYTDSQQTYNHVAWMCHALSGLIKERYPDEPARVYIKLEAEETASHGTMYKPTLICEYNSELVGELCGEFVKDVYFAVSRG